MGFGTLKDLYLDELATLYDAELQISRTLRLEFPDSAQARALKRGS